MTGTTTAWRTSSFSSNGSNCVEVLELASDTWLRDSKDRGGPVLRLSPPRWRAFLADVVDDRAERDGTAERVADGVPYPHVAADGGRALEDVTTATVLHFTADEWSAFRRGVLAGEFGPVERA